ncbi:hypothetical protein CMESO_262 (nucleomorph) [Chroomonas mesostigmatica CCMP1168]|uniref:Transmembrane protein n=1 Tax=Chroomonas mesostigmatica CCMP1168 TaxID=1195612 RepID=J7G320_9CRYP|nr:hypothetical protein CMESO_262 [Chroomonas mesostigmatica CCMP1168]|mmetsp:Transcript_66762/g.164532  ORF Transcript_66762/g.164532 Transcript_66762/m.164532 type:complete len:97 (-) Transcript_66762:1336-1626(-)
MKKKTKKKNVIFTKKILSGLQQKKKLKNIFFLKKTQILTPVESKFFKIFFFQLIFYHDEYCSLAIRKIFSENLRKFSGILIFFLGCLKNYFIIDFC